MIRTYVINVAGEDKRLSEIAQALSHKSIGFRRIDAITPASMKHINITSDCDILYPSMLPPACLISHLKALMTFLSEYADGDFCLILEDDVTPAPSLTSERLRNLISTAPNNFEILQLGTSHTKGSKLLLDHRRSSSLYWHNWHYAFWGAYAYLVTAEGAGKIVENLFSSCILDLSGFYCPELCVADYLLFDICKTYTSTYPWFGHLGVDSSVRPESVAHEQQTIAERNQFLRSCWQLP